ncbi:MBL fold metallo-hydrolase [Salinadaptatus halalkaliphilus]|uniref:MBL fold metallo-hydrolase n=1 Tax=Salinadaptatus halalkaliphilus TaxID=2419781 RepID=A0A4S3TN16_9EURY|nr:MBL fold metallo-hydrolase [Salinadaptatus halalkaliphilus]THE65020.1 MBL fold metallo-hydrolase [Salinadaptatus halalkaliphilus]
MIQSDWGDWLVRDVESATPEGVAIWYLGCNGLILKDSDGTTIYIDPYLGLGDPPRTVRMIPVPFDPEDVTDADAVLATHEHTDHVHGPSQAPILESSGTFYGADDSLAVAHDEEWTTEWDVADDQLVEVSEGDTLEIGAFTVHVEVANDPDATHPVSYVLEHDAGTVFHGGDTKPSDEFDRLGDEYEIDLGILAFGTVGQIPDKETREPKRTRWYNDENQIVEAASALEVDRLVPTHWDMWKGLTADPTVLHHHARSFEHPTRLEIVEIGDRVDLA